MFTCGNPVLFGGWVNLEDVGPCAEDGLLTAKWKMNKQKKKRKL